MGSKKPIKKVLPSTMTVGMRIAMAGGDFWMVICAPERQKDGQWLIRTDAKPNGTLATPSTWIPISNEDIVNTEA